MFNQNVIIRYSSENYVCTTPIINRAPIISCSSAHTFELPCPHAMHRTTSRSYSFFFSFLIIRFTQMYVTIQKKRSMAISVSINSISACNNTSLRHSLRDLALKGQTWQISQLIQLQSNQTQLPISTVFKFGENVTKT